MKKFYIFILLALVSFVASARRISESEARGLAAGKVPSLAKDAMRVHPQGTTLSGSEAPIYLFNSSKGGFAVVSGDDRMPNMLLAYSDNGFIDLDNCSPAMRAWFDEMSSFISAGDFSKVTRLKSADYTNPVSPLITTKWNQDAPFNLMTPIGPNGLHCATGCAATAMAQVVNYWQWPREGGIAANSYEWNGQTLSVDFRESRYDWANMADVYNENSTEAQNNAVAKLMWECGVAIDMNYGEEESGTSDLALARGLIDFMGYNPGLDLLNRDFIPADEWFALVQNELDSARPVLYCGATPNQEGHAFVCDGYDESGLFHINWGWGGMCDGYFDISTLNPEAQGIGGAESGEGFSEQQSIIINLRPAQEGDVASLGWQLVIEDFDIQPENDDSSLFSIEWEISNYGFRSFEGELFVTMSYEGNPEETEKELLEQFTGDNILQSNQNFTIEISELDASELEDGVYRLQLTARDIHSGYEEEVRLPVVSLPTRFEVKDGKIFYDVRPRLEISDILIDEMGFYYTSGNSRCMLSELKFNLENTSDVWFIDGLAVTVTYPVSDGENIEETYSLIDIPQIGPEEKVEVVLPIQYNVEGTIKVSLASCSRTDDEEKAPQEIVLNMNEFEFDAEGDYCELALAEMPEVTENEGVVTIKAKVGSCTGELEIEGGLSIDQDAETEREITCTIYNTESDQLASTIKAVYTGKWNEIKTLTFTTAEPLENGNYYAELTYRSAPTASGNILDITLGEENEDFPGIQFGVTNSGIDSVAVDNTPDSSVEVYSVAGQRMPANTRLVPGFYFEIRGGKAQKVLVK